MKRFILIALMVTFSFAEVLNVVNDNPEAQIFINGQIVGTGSVEAYEVLPGSHLVKVLVDGEKTYSEIVEIEAGKVKSLDTSHFVDVKTEYANKGAKSVEAGRIRESLGDYGLGFYLGPVTSGLSFKWFGSNDLGIQTTGWLAADATTSFYNFEVRALYLLATNVINKKLQSLYLAVGAGKSEYDDGSSSVELREIMEVALGIETAATGMLDDTAVSSIFNDAFVSLELGFNRIIKNHKFEYQGVKLSAAMHWYF